MKKLLLIAVALLFIVSTFPNVKADYRATLYPSQGSVLTEIFLEVRDVGGVLYLYWDDLFLGTFFENFPYEDFVGFDIFFNPPNVHPYSDVGNHTVFFEVWYKYWDGQDYYVYWNCSLTFEIIEYYPCDEYLALNATYHELLDNYTGLLGDFNTLLFEYNDLLTDYNSMSVEYDNLLGSLERLNSSYYGLESSYANLNSIYSELSYCYSQLQSDYSELSYSYSQLQSDYSELSYSYSQLQSDHSRLQENYDELSANYSYFLTNYTGLRSDYDSLSSSYDVLGAGYNLLESDNNNLTASYNALVGQLNTTRNLGYVFMAATVVLIATTVYFAVRKPKNS